MHGVYKLQVSQNARQIPAQAALLSYRHINVQDAELSQRDTVASLWWVTPGAATEGVTSLFFSEKNFATFFAHQSSLSLFIDFTRVSPLEGVTQHLFYLSDLVSPLFFVNLPTKIFSSGGTPWRMSPGAVRPPPLVTPLESSRTRCRMRLFWPGQKWQTELRDNILWTLWVYIQP